jgi:cell division protein ZapA
MPGTEVYILGQKYSIKGDASPEHIQELARDIDSKIKEVCSKYPNISPMNALILAAFNMADEIARLKTDQDTVTRNIKEKTDLLVELFE